ncbi:hypothetical protein [Thalassotalea crassostreae]|uniref:hypothetical protein n=1 Tax=Thalassotalea crassostreae TaxID=1763536 RepID=UPI0008396525|nr:hypothetical protein [Thalassotalea crassostreae]
MYLSKSLYEKTPFLYVALAAYVFYTQNSFIAIFASSILYLAAAVIWIKRSDHRRKNRILQTLNHFKIPQLIYEFYPFLFLAIFAAIIKYSQQAWVLAVGLLLALIAIKNLIMRHQARINPVKLGKNFTHKSD